MMPLNTAYKNASAFVGGSPSPFISQLMASGAVTYEQAAAVHWDPLAWFNYRVQMVPLLDELLPGERAWLDQNIIGSHRSFGVGRLWYETNKALLSTNTVRYIDNLFAHPG